MCLITWSKIHPIMLQLCQHNNFSYYASIIRQGLDRDQSRLHVHKLHTCTIEIVRSPHNAQKKLYNVHTTTEWAYLCIGCVYLSYTLDRSDCMLSVAGGQIITLIVHNLLWTRGPCTGPLSYYHKTILHLLIHSVEANWMGKDTSSLIVKGVAH